MVRNTGFHGWRYPESLVNPAKIVVHEVNGDHVLMVFQFLAESVGQASKAPHSHAH
jgi:hypothetical protein